MKTRKKKREFENKYAAMDALKKGSLLTRLSALVFGAGCLVQGQIVKGILFLAAEIAIVYYMIQTGLHNLGMLRTLGEVEQQKVWNDAKSVYEYVDGDRSQLILLFGIISLAILLVLILLGRSSLRQAYKAECLKKEGKRVPGFVEEMRELFNNNLHMTLLSFPVAGVLAFTILPLVFMISMAFTSYSVEDSKLVLFDWVGLDNFKRVIGLGGSLGKTFWPVLGWTLIWALVATFSNYFCGLILALFINWKEIRAKKMWRFFFALTVAIPHFVTLLIMRTILQPEGAVNIILRSMGLLGAKESLPFFTDATWARVTVILINIWVGVPYMLLQVTGILQNIPQELYEAARVDGAGPIVIFRKITLPYMMFIMMPYLITTFTGNVNNFNVIFLTSQGLPRPVGSTAGKTDLLVTWLYKLTIENQYYNIGAVIGIMTFVTLAIVSLITFKFSGSNKNEEAFR